MALEMRKSSKWWYGRFSVNGKVRCQNLNVLIEGERPASVSQEGNGAFERSRGKAQAALDELLEEAQSKRQAEDYVQRLHEIRTGRKIDSIPLAKLSEEWDRAPRKRKGSPRYIQQAHKLFDRFTAFVAETYPKTETLADVTPEIGEAFMVQERARGVSGRTCNATLILLRSAFKVVSRRANIVRNPFDGIPTMDEKTTHRQPFSQDELKAILDCAMADEFIRPVVVTGICTAMRRGDCCLLTWDAVDLNERFVRVKTSKTGETVEIPMFPLLHRELVLHEGNDSEYVFPEQAAMFLSNPQGITYRIKNLLKAAGFYDEEKAKKGKAKTGVVRLGDVSAKREQGLRRASVRDFHSFRVTWITLALAAGVPLEIVQRVTGHKTTEVVLKHYFRPGREDFRRTLEGAMPTLFTASSAKLLTAGQTEQEAGPSEKLDEAMEILNSVTGKANQERVSRAVELIEAARKGYEQPARAVATA